MHTRTHRLPIAGMAVAVVLALCAACGRQKPPAPDPSAPTPAQAAPIPALPVPVLPAPKATAPQSDEERLLGENSVWWNIQPTGAVLRIRGTRSDLVVTALTERVETRVATGFYTVEISAEGYETWTRRTPLGGSSTNQTVTLFALPPPPPPKPAVDPSALAAAAPKPAPFFPEREVRDLRKALEESEVQSSKSEVQSPKSEVASAEPPSMAVEEPSVAVETPVAPPVEPASVAQSASPVPPPSERGVAQSAGGSIPGAAHTAPQDSEPPPATPVEPASVAQSAPHDPPPSGRGVAQSAGGRTRPEGAQDSESSPAPAVVVAVPQDQSVANPVPPDSALRTSDLGLGTLDSTLLPTRLVRGSLESTAPGDTGFFSEPMTLSIGALVRRIDAGGFALAYEDIGGAPITVRIRNYDVRGPVAAPAVSPAGVAQLVYRATPHPATIRFPDLDAEAIPCHAATGRPVAGWDPATRTLRAVPAYTPLDIVIRRRGCRIHTVHVEPQKPGAKVSFPDVRSIPLPAYGRKGDRQVIDLGDGTGLSLVWIPGGRVENPAVRGAVDTVPRGFWISEHPVTRRQWRAALGGIGADGANRPDGDPVSIARTGFGAFAQSLMAAEPRMSARLPHAAELRLAAASGLRKVNPAAELTLADPGEPERPGGPFHVVIAMGL